MSGNHKQRVEALRQWLGYPIKQRDPEKNLFWYLRPGADDDAASETRPVAVGFYSELNERSDLAIKAWVASKGNEISQHFFDWFEDSNQPVMYLLLPKAQQAGRVALVLPSESRQWRQRQVLTHAWDSSALLTPLGRLQQGELELMQKVEDKPMFSVPLVEWAFYKPIATAKELAQELARVSRQMEQAIPAVYAAEGADGYLKTLYESFKRELLPTLKVSSDNSKDYSFADIYAQTIAYGLFTARMFSHVRDPKADFNRQDAWDKLPETNPFLRQLFQGISEQPVEALGDELADKISEVFSILRAAKMDAILSDFRQKMNREDIVIRFYEDFLKAYKPEMRERRGVYYTPEPVVSYMVRSVDILLKEKFDKPLGLADPEVMILDPACGTGTFLLYIFQEIRKKFLEKPEALTEGLEDKSWSGYVQERLLPRVFGFELLMAPYAIAHLKLGLFLEETGYRFEKATRLGVYLTNTLGDSLKKTESLFEEFIAEESDQAAEIKKDKPVMVVVGNPPYSVSSVNQGEWITSLLQEYKKNLDERKINLDDDYIKFIRFAQHRIDTTGHGILAFITNHSYLSGVVHRQMRLSLGSTFGDIKIIDIHGNSILKERCPDGSKDENIFDIQQGVSIFMGTRSLGSESKTETRIEFSDLFGLRDSKYESLEKQDITSTAWNVLSPKDSDYFFFCPKDFSLSTEYSSYYSVPEIFSQYVSGIQTKRDSITISFDVDRLKEVVSDLQVMKSEDFRGKYNLAKDGRDWTIDLARKNVESFQPTEDYIRGILYRPFDIRSTYYNSKSKGFIAYPRYNVMKHMVLGYNLGLIIKRQMANDEASYFLVSDKIISEGVIGIDNKGREFLFPLFIYSESDESQKQLLEAAIEPNFSASFVHDVRQRLGFMPEPESVVFYVYAFFYCPSYRIRYRDLLRVDFPRVPVTSDVDLFKKLAGYGEALVNLHLMKSPVLENLITQFENGDRTVDPGHPKYANGKVSINKRGDGFTGVPQEVWEFYVGGYQVCHKWLKDRKGRTLSDDDILHYQKIIVALQETIRIMQQIDDAIPSWPIE